MLSNRRVFLSISFILLCIAKCKHMQNTKELKCLWWSTEKRSFLDAKRNCAGKGGHLATFRTREKMKILQEKTKDYWIGLDDREREGVFKNHDDYSTMDIKGCYGELYFNSDEPKSRRHKENCIHLYGKTKKLASDPCWSTKLYVCDVPCNK